VGGRNRGSLCGVGFRSETLLHVWFVELNEKRADRSGEWLRQVIVCRKRVAKAPANRAMIKSSIPNVAFALHGQDPMPLPVMITDDRSGLFRPYRGVQSRG
jgi:hypothetical protein